MPVRLHRKSVEQIFVAALREPELKESAQPVRNAEETTSPSLSRRKANQKKNVSSPLFSPVVSFQEREGAFFWREMPVRIHLTLCHAAPLERLDFSSILVLASKGILAKKDSRLEQRGFLVVNAEGTTCVPASNPGSLYLLLPPIIFQASGHVQHLKYKD